MTAYRDRREAGYYEPKKQKTTTEATTTEDATAYAVGYVATHSKPKTTKPKRAKT